LTGSACRNVRGRALVYTPVPDGGWTQRVLALPNNASIHIVATDRHSEQAFLGVTGFLTPTSLWLADAAGGEPARVKQKMTYFTRKLMD
jgi:prolyl oligopeptidase